MTGTLRVFAGHVTTDDIIIQPYTDARGVVVDIVTLACDREHVGIRIATDDGVTSALFHIFDVVTVAVTS